MKTLKTQKGTELPLLNLKGKDYLPVALRLVWFREEHPDWSIETEFLVSTDQSAVAKASIRGADNRVMATSHKEESSKDFPAGHREKAETGAIGRALALCGYGTQFEPEFDEGSRVVDAPIRPVGTIFPDQPMPGDGFAPPNYYRIDFGKWRDRTLEQVFRDEGADAIKSYITYLEDAAQKQGKQIDGKIAKFIQEAELLLGAFENSPIEIHS